MHLALIPPNTMMMPNPNKEVTMYLPHHLKDPLISSQLATNRPSLGYRILDNGAAEGVQKPLNFLINAAPLVDEVVALDKMGFCDETINLTKAMKDFNSFLQHPVKIMGCVHGETWEKVWKCLNHMIWSDYIDVVGLPRILCAMYGDAARLRLIESWSHDPGRPMKPIHCLGGHYAWPREVYHLAKMEFVRSMDSSMPYVYGLYGVPIDTMDHHLVTKRPDGYFDVAADEFQTEVIACNVGLYTKWSKGS